MSKWRLAKSLERLRWEVNTLYPKRSKASDGTIGDKAHAKRRSDHNPLPNGVVCAIDITHDPKSGANMQAIADYILKYRHPAIVFVLFNRRQAGIKTKWKWIPYTGKNKHTKHMHVSVVQDAARYDIEGTWLKNFEQEEQMKSALTVNGKVFNDFDIDVNDYLVKLRKFVAAINGVNDVKATVVWNKKEGIAKVTVRADYDRIKKALDK